MEKLDWYYYYGSQKNLIRTWKEFQKYWKKSFKIITNYHSINFYNFIGAFWLTKDLIKCTYRRTKEQNYCSKRKSKREETHLTWDHEWRKNKNIEYVKRLRIKKSNKNWAKEWK